MPSTRVATGSQRRATGLRRRRPRSLSRAHRRRRRRPKRGRGRSTAPLCARGGGRSSCRWMACRPARAGAAARLVVRRTSLPTARDGHGRWRAVHAGSGRSDGSSAAGPRQSGACRRTAARSRPGSRATGSRTDGQLVGALDAWRFRGRATRAASIAPGPASSTAWPPRSREPLSLHSIARRVAGRSGAVARAGTANAGDDCSSKASLESSRGA